MRRDRERDEAELEAERLRAKAGSRAGRQSDEEWLQEAQEIARQRKRQRSATRAYFQPVEALWRQFMEYRRWTPTDVDELADDWLYGEWMRYNMQRHYGIPLLGSGGW